MKNADFELGYDYALWEIEKLMGESNDPISFSLKVGKLVFQNRKGVEHERICREYDAPKAI